MFDNKTLKKWQQLNKIAIGITKGGNDGQLCIISSNGQNITGKCFGYVPSGKAIALKADDGNWYIYANLAKSFNASFSRNISYRKNLVKKKISPNIVGFRRFFDRYRDILYLYGNEEFEEIDNNPDGFHNFPIYSSHGYIEPGYQAYTVHKNYISYDSICFSGLINKFIFFKGSGVYIGYFGTTDFYKITLDLDSFEVQSNHYFKSSSFVMPDIPLLSFPPGLNPSYIDSYIVKYIDELKAIRFCLISGYSIRPHGCTGCYIWDLGILENLNLNNNEMSCFFGQIENPSSEEVFNQNYFRGQLVDCYGANNGIVLVFNEMIYFQVEQNIMQSANLLDKGYKIFIPASFLQGSNGTLLQDSSIIIEYDSADKKIYFDNNKNSTYYCTKQIVPVNLNTRKPWLLNPNNNYDAFIEKARLTGIYLEDNPFNLYYPIDIEEDRDKIFFDNNI